MQEQVTQAREASSDAEYVRLKQLIESSPEVDLAPMAQALKEKKISIDQFVELSLQLDRRNNLIIQGLADVSNLQSEEIMKLGIDTTTGLKKHDSLEKDLTRLISELNFKPESQDKQRRPLLCCLMVIALDVDNLKGWNNLGRHIGDKALRTLADSIREHTRDIDHIYRRGDQSDEFIIVLRIEKEMTPEDIQNTFDQVKEAANSGYVEISGRRLPVTAAAGYILVNPGDTRGVEEILNDAHGSQESDKKDPEIKNKRIEQARRRLH